MTIYSVGKDVLSYCKKCELNLSHIIVVMKDSATPKKVQCNTCNSVHVYKDPNKSTPKKKKAKTTKRKSSAIANSETWEARLKSSNQEDRKKYSIKDKYLADDIIDHPKFGIGAVEKLIDGNKIEVLFENEIKVLMHGIS